MSDFLSLGLNMPMAMGYPVPSWVKPGATIDIDFINNRAWFAGLQSLAFARTIFTRNSVGTYYGPDGFRKTAAINEPRFDHHPLTGARLGLLSESRIFNYAKYSNDFTNAAWSKTGLTLTQNAIIGPDGEMSATKVEANTASFVNFNQPVTNAAVATTGMTFSCHYKKGSGATDGGRILLRNNTTGTNLSVGNFNFDTGLMNTTGGIGWVQPLQNGWFRLAVTSITGWSTNDTAAGYIGFTGGTGDLGKYVYVADAMLERWSGPSSYIASPAGTALARDTEFGDIPVSQFNYNTLAGTLFVEDSLRSGLPITYVAGSACFHNGDGVTNSELIRQDYYYPSPLLRLGSNMRHEAVNIADQLFTVNFDTVNRTVLSWATDDVVTSVNGSAVLIDTSATIPTGITHLAIGRGRAIDHNLNGLTRRITYWNKRMTNPEVVALSS